MVVSTAHNPTTLPPSATLMRERTREGWNRIMERAWALKVARDALVQEVMSPSALSSVTDSPMSAPTSGASDVVSAGKPSGNKAPLYRPRMDLYDDPEMTHIMAALELPGLKRDSIKVVVQDQFLIVSGERKPFRRTLPPSAPYALSSSPPHQPQQQYRQGGGTTTPKAEPAEVEGDGMIVDSEPAVTPMRPPSHYQPTHRQESPPSPPSTGTVRGRRPATPYDPIADARQAAASDPSLRRQSVHSASASVTSFSFSNYQSHALARLSASPDRNNEGGQYASSRFNTSSERDEPPRSRSNSPQRPSGAHSQPQVLGGNLSGDERSPTPTGRVSPASTVTPPHRNTPPAVTFTATTAPGSAHAPTHGVSATPLPIHPSHSKSAHAHRAPTPNIHVVREFKFGRFQRVIALGPGVHASDVRATLDDGILTVCWPRPSESVVRELKEREVRVGVEGGRGAAAGRQACEERMEN